MDLPIDFINKMKKLLDDSADDFFSHLDKPSVKGITLNTDRISKEKFENICDFEHSPIEHVDNGYYVDNFRFSSHILNHLGVIYSQEPSAMYPVELLEIEEDDIVLDVCASPGGKSIQILEKLKGSGLLVSNEIVFNRAKILYENISRMGFRNYAITCNSPEDYEKTNLKFDKILIDAPCGGEGMLRKKDFDLKAYNPNAIETNAKRQLNILESIKGLLRVGGRLVYSTCTYDTRENEEVIAKFLKLNPDFKIIKDTRLNDVMEQGIKIDNFDTDLGYRRYPHLHRGEGQFMIVLTKVGEEEETYSETFRALNYSDPHNKELDAVNKILKESTTLNKYKITKRNDSLYLLPDITINFGKLNVIHIGCCLGTINKNILKVGHSFYHTYGEYFKNKIEIEGETLTKFLHGEEIDIDSPNGLAVVTHHGIALSGGKATQGKLKNNYPKELRI